MWFNGFPDSLSDFRERKFFRKSISTSANPRAEKSKLVEDFCAKVGIEFEVGAITDYLDDILQLNGLFEDFEIVNTSVENLREAMEKKDFLFNKNRYRILIVSLLIVGIGFILMSGGASDDPEIFSDEIYNFRRIRLAPLIVIIGFTLCIFTILKKSKN